MDWNQAVSLIGALAAVLTIIITGVSLFVTSRKASVASVDKLEKGLTAKIDTNVAHLGDKVDTNAAHLGDKVDTNAAHLGDKVDRLVAAVDIISEKLPPLGERVARVEGFKDATSAQRVASAVASNQESAPRPNTVAKPPPGLPC